MSFDPPDPVANEEELAAQMEEDLRREEEHQRFLEREGLLQPPPQLSGQAAESQATTVGAQPIAAAPEVSPAEVEAMLAALPAIEAEIEAANEAQIRFEDVQQTLLRMEFPEMFPAQ